MATETDLPMSDDDIFIVIEALDRHWRLLLRFAQSEVARPAEAHRAFEQVRVAKRLCHWFRAAAHNLGRKPPRSVLRSLELAHAN